MVKIEAFLQHVSFLKTQVHGRDLLKVMYCTCQKPSGGQHCVTSLISDQFTAFVQLFFCQSLLNRFLFTYRLVFDQRLKEIQCKILELLLSTAPLVVVHCLANSGGHSSPEFRSLFPLSSETDAFCYGFLSMHQSLQIFP